MEKPCPAATLRMPTMNKPGGRQAGATIIELVIVVVILAVIFGSIMVALKQAVTITTAYSTAPATVSQTPATGTFVYSVVRPVAGQPSAAVPNRRTTFKVSPTAGARIVSVTDAAGNIIAAGRSQAEGVTDANGNVTVVVAIDYVGQALLTATDVASGASEPVLFTGVP